MLTILPQLEKYAWRNKLRMKETHDYRLSCFYKYLCDLVICVIGRQFQGRFTWLIITMWNIVIDLDIIFSFWGGSCLHMLQTLSLLSVFECKNEMFPE